VFKITFNESLGGQQVSSEVQTGTVKIILILSCR